MMQTLTGIFPVLPTPFRADGSADAVALARLVAFAVRSGVAGVVYPGFASEVETLARGERSGLLKAVADAAGEGTTVIAGASAATAEEVVEHGKTAAELGINHLMIQPPNALGGEVESVIAFMSKIAEALPDAQIILQNAPAPRGSDLSPATIVAVVRAVRQVVYVKEETLPAGPAITHILKHRPDNLLGVFGGGGARYILDEYARGACAAMPALELAPEHVAMDRAWRAGRKDEARDIYVRTLPLLVLQAVYRMRLTKYVLMRRGALETIGVRAPTPELDASVRMDIEANLAALGIADPLPEMEGA
ncbi:dihydrodipicolinate synthase [Nitratireductor indicus C115]|uniref:Dihydrodipicolinate synthase n=1 Tax=Nitratireductor indicus C115 TaxID=1231190 RepID=K2NUY8_9HYPH|nr:dihydrodipicolinate synthase family protein [Nitratireductor indicus]EKF43115.1 dihydrodipicolinate synthase [Nitratireductor indicus C115]SFQ52908.1 4-hydroxy-tetrahydrodipicolinate synthase [Nitratireductor indicus]